MTPLFAEDLVIEDRRLVELDEGDMFALQGAVKLLELAGYLLVPEVLRGIVRAYENSGPAGVGSTSDRTRRRTLALR